MVFYVENNSPNYVISSIFLGYNIIKKLKHSEYVVRLNNIQNNILLIIKLWRHASRDIFKSLIFSSQPQLGGAHNNPLLKMREAVCD